MVAPSAGLVETMYGFAQTVKKLHGFGTGPAVRGRPWSSFPAVISAVYTVHVAKLVPWLSVRTSRLPFQVPASVIPPEIVHATVPVFIGSLNVTTRAFVTGTFTAPSTGSVVTIYGLTQIVVKVHGFGALPGTRSRPSFWSLPPVI